MKMQSITKFFGYYFFLVSAGQMILALLAAKLAPEKEDPAGRLKRKDCSG